MTLIEQQYDINIQYDINRTAGKIPTSSSGKIDKFEYHR